MRAALCVALAACSGTTPEPASPAPPPAAVEPAQPPPAMPISPVRAAQAAATGHTIQVVAVTAAGDAVATADFNHAIRLWPSLEGTREPVVVTGPSTVDTLAIARDADTYAIAVLDTAGTIHLERLGRDLAQTAETSVESPLPYAQVEGTRTGFIALRTDDVVELIAIDGTRRTVAPPPVRITRLVVRGDAVLALTDGVARPLVDGAWGDATGKLELATTNLALSPDGKRLAGSAGPNLPLVEITLATGARHPVETTNTVVVGYFDDTTLATTSGGNISFHTPIPRNSGFDAVMPSGELATAVGDHRIVSGVQTQLALPEPGRTQWLGYDLTDPTPLHTTASGLIARTDRPTIVDDGLTIRPLFDKPHEGDWLDFTMLDGRYVVALVREWGEDTERRWCELWDLATHKVVQKVDADARLDTLAWEPSTQLFAALSVHGATLYHYAAGKLTRTATLQGSPERMFLLDPTVAHGSVAVLLENGVLTAVDADGRPHGAVPFHGRLLTVDRSGRAIATQGPELSIGGQSFVGLGQATVRVSPDLQHVAAFTNRGITMIDADGTQRWSIVAWGVRDLGWTPDGRLISSQGGLVQLDVATGQVLGLRCGWTFGLAATVHTGATVGLSACDS